jgi:ribosomal protein S12 methylthiotransferase
VFTYSHEEDTRAFALADDVPNEMKARRRDALMHLQQSIVLGRHESMLGQVIDVMVDGPSPESELVVTARHAGQAPDIDSVVYLTECDPSEAAAGQVLRAEILQARGYDLVARPLR